MTGTANQFWDTIRVVTYDETWPHRYATERTCVLAATGPHLTVLEHVGSTAIPGLPAKPIIDMMAGVATLHEGMAAVAALAPLGYDLRETGMPQRLFLRKRDPAEECAFHLHIVEYATWHERNERLFRDYLRANPEAAQAYGQLKQQLATAHADDALAYTKGKTRLIQALVDRARDERGLPRVNVWNWGPATS